MTTSKHFHLILIRGLFLIAGLMLTACGMLAPSAQVVSTEAPTTSAPTATPQAVATPAEMPGPTPLPGVEVIVVEPTATPSPGDALTEVDDLPLGQREHYVNLTFGYHLRHPADWYTGFGNRPLLVSFSNLDPGTHDRLSMRTEGCLIEIRASTNVLGLTLHEMRPQLTLAFDEVQEFRLSGEPALRILLNSKARPFEGEWVYVEHDDRLFLISYEYGHGLNETCRPGWKKLLSSWEWFAPEFAVYRNPTYGYAISYPNWWYRFNPHERGVSIASQDPTGMTDVVEFILQEEMLVQTDVYDNLEGLPLKEWLADQYLQVELTDDIPLDGFIGVRALRAGPSPEVRVMSGYFQGPEGRIYAVTCLYPAERRLVFRSIANAILFSFSF